MPRAGAVDRKPRGRYHHGDLRRALIQEAIRTINEQGVPALTLRAAGQRLGVSRTALYRHFADKAALLAAVGAEGFRAFTSALQDAMAASHQPRARFVAMGRAYVAFAQSHPAHYRVMFGGFLDACRDEPDLLAAATASFQLLVEVIAAQQAAGLLRHDDPRQMARFVWATVHGIAMLAIDGQLRGEDIDLEVAYASERLVAALAPRPALTRRRRS